MQLDPLPIAALALLCVVAYWAAHWYYSRLGEKIPVVGKRPPVKPLHQQGRTSILALGTYGLEMAKRLAIDFVRANCVGQVSFLIIELNRERRQAIFELFPRAIRRVVWGDSSLADSGLENAPLDKVNTPKMRTKWAFDLRGAVSRFCALVRRPGLFYRAMEPSIVVGLVSPGGHLLLAIEGARLFLQQFGAALYAVTVWPKQEAQQRELAKALQLHAEEPVFRWWLVTDNLLDPAKNDRAVAMLFACLTQAHRVLPRTEDAYNLFGTIYPPNDGRGVAVTRFWERNVAVYPTPLPPRDYLVNRGDVVKAVLAGIDAIDTDENTKTILLETPLAETRRFVIVNVALRQPYLAELEHEIHQRLGDAGWSDNDPHRTLIFSSLGEDLNPSSEFITVSVMSLEMANKGIDGVVEMAPAQVPTSQAASATTQAAISETAQELVPFPAPTPTADGATPLDAPLEVTVNGSAASSATDEQEEPLPPQLSAPAEEVDRTNRRRPSRRRQGR